jgi:magnesium transporter
VAREPAGSRDSAGDFATRRVPTAAPGRTAEEVRGSLAGLSFHSVADVALLEAEALVGVVPMAALLAADPGAPIESLVRADNRSIGPEVDIERAASLMAEDDGASLAVVDADGRFRGLIAPSDVLAVLAREHEEDLARIGGYRAGSKRARRAAEESVEQRLRHRLPWLLVGLLGAMASAVLIGSFEEELDRKILLAFFVPAVVYMADAVGTQTEAILIRGLSVGITVREVVGREILTGAITGAIVGVAFIPFVLVGWGDSRVALAVALALFASCSIATLVAMALPWFFQRLGVDPAFGSGPLATVAQDLLSIAAYLAIAIPLAA